jgi:hypothetical protein
VVVCEQYFFAKKNSRSFAVSKRLEMGKKSSKTFVLHTDALNSQKFRMLTKGADLSDFEKNPVMLFNHVRPEGGNPGQILPIGYWTDIEVSEDKITAVPVFDENDAFAMSIYDKVEQGLIKMASVGAEPLAMTDEPDLLLEGQEKETVTQWRMIEASIVAFGSNPEALALYDADRNIITLFAQGNTDIIPKLQDKMTKVTKPTGKKPANSKKPEVALADDPKKEEELEDTTNEEELEDEDDNETPEEKLARLTEENEQLKMKLAQLEEKLAQLSEEDEDKKVDELADKAVRMRKITLSQKPMIKQMARADWNATVKYLNSIKVSESVKASIEKQELERTVYQWRVGRVKAERTGGLCR